MNEAFNFTKSVPGEHVSTCHHRYHNVDVGLIDAAPISLSRLLQSDPPSIKLVGYTCASAGLRGITH
jgi:hypothetical protein